MAARFFARVTANRVLAGGAAAAGGAGLAVNQLLGAPSQATVTKDAQAEFEKGWGYKNVVKVPASWSGPKFEIRTSYPGMKNASPAVAGGLPTLPGPDQPRPGLSPIEDAPWLAIDFKNDPMAYCKIIKEYCWEGNANNNFRIRENRIRDWYHAPWMHWNVNGREPLNGLTFEKPTKPLELSSNQKRPLQTWACGFYNWTGMRGDPRALSGRL